MSELTLGEKLITSFFLPFREKNFLYIPELEW